MKRIFLSMLIACAAWVAGAAQDAYTVEILPTENGTVTSDKATAIVGETVTLTLTPSRYYMLNQLVVESELIGGGFSDEDPWGPAMAPAYIMVPTTKVSENIYTFVMPASKVKVQATFTLKGDMDNNGVINVADVTLLISHVLNSGEYIDKADVDGNGAINVADVTLLISIVLNQ
jgi:hypothetical protein